MQETFTKWYTVGMQGTLRNPFAFNRYVKESERMQANTLAARDMQAFTDLARSGYDPFDYTFLVNDRVLRAQAVEGVDALVYNPRNGTWEPCANDAPAVVQSQAGGEDAH